MNRDENPIEHLSRSNGALTRRSLLGITAALGTGATVFALDRAEAEHPGDASGAMPVQSASGLSSALTPDLLAVRHHRVRVDDVEVFYREAGDPKAPTLLLLHGFPTSSHMFRNLIPTLADRWHLVAPDYPGFGFSGFPDREAYDYSFAAYAGTLAKFTDAIGLGRYAIYIQDYGAPVGLRLALLWPDRVTGLVVQNGNAYEEGLSEAWTPLKVYWQDPTPANREMLRGWLDAAGTRMQYVAGVPEGLVERFGPESWTLDWALLSRPGNIELQLDLFGDYRTNVALYPDFHEFFRTRRPPTLIVWGRHDPFFTVAGAEAYKRDLPDAELHLLDTGHFALETHGAEIATLLRAFFDKVAAVDAG